MNERDILRFVLGSTQAQCRELAAIFAQWADAPRDEAWKHMMRQRIAQLPAPDEAGIPQIIREARQRVIDGEAQDAAPAQEQVH